MSLFKNMKTGGASYGVVPGNGNPRADDKVMVAGAGHVVPAENAHIAKKIVNALGYDPNVKVDMNQGAKSPGPSVGIKISSKEYFLNQQQVDEMKNVGIDPEMLSPNSDYNQRVNGATTKQVEDMTDNKLFGLMNNQHPAYQNGGGVSTTDPVVTPQYTSGFPMEFQSMLHKSMYGNEGNEESTRWAANTANTEWPKYLAGNSQYQHLNVDPEIIKMWNPSYQSAVNNEPGTNPDNVSLLPRKEVDLQSMQGQRTPIASSLNIPNGQNPVISQTNSVAVSPSASTPNQNVSQTTSASPEDKHVQDLIQKSKDLENQEVAANKAMGLWNMSRERQPMPEPVYMSPSLIRRDYESYKNDLSSDIERAERRGNYQAKQLGMGATATVAMAANSQEAIRKGDRSIWDMQQQDIAHNVGVENQSKSSYQGMKLQRDMADSQVSQAFSQQKGQAMADNVREIFGAKEAGLYRTGELQGVAANRTMDQLDKDYSSLDKEKMLRTNTGYISRDKYYKMSEQERQQLHEKLK